MDSLRHLDPPEPPTGAPDAQQLESELRRALEQGDLHVDYQPKLELASGRVVGFEALARWHHPELGSVPPDRFIPVAEQAGLIAALGEHVLRTACRQARSWRDEGLPAVRLSVNFSAQQFVDEALADRVIETLDRFAITGRQLDVEITESAMARNRGVTARVLERLKGIGVTVSLDDFGTGCASLVQLRRFAVDTVKIDGCFVRGVTHDPEAAELTAAIISGAKALSLNLVAEGVETEDQRLFLARLGCDEVQGYLFSPPLSPEDATAFLRERAPASEPARAFASG